MSYQETIIRYIYNDQFWWLIEKCQWKRKYSILYHFYRSENILELDTLSINSFCTENLVYNFPIFCNEWIMSLLKRPNEELRRSSWTSLRDFIGTCWVFFYVSITVMYNNFANWHKTVQRIFFLFSNHSDLHIKPIRFESSIDIV